MMSERGLSVDHRTIYRWVQTYAPELEKRIRLHLRLTNDSYRVDETYVKIRGKWYHLSFNTARRTIGGYEAMNMIRKGQIEWIGIGDIRGQVKFEVNLFNVAA